VLMYQLLGDPLLRLAYPHEKSPTAQIAGAGNGRTLK
jgi:hypothetical protein